MLNSQCMYTLTLSVPYAGQVCSDKHKSASYTCNPIAFQSHGHKQTLVLLALLMMVSRGFARLTRSIVVSDAALVLCL